MNEITINGNLTNEPAFRYSEASRRAVLTFTVAVNDRRYDQGKGKWVDAKPVFHSVVAFNLLAENAGNSLRKGMAVIVTGKLVNNSWTDAAGVPHYRTDLLASDIGPSLRWATAEVSKRAPQQTQPEPGLDDSGPGEPAESPDTAPTDAHAQAA